VHIPDGSISPHLSVPAWAAALPLWAWSFKRLVRGEKEEGPRRPDGSSLLPSEVERIPVAGALTAFAFVVQTIMIPIPGGTSAHVAGATLIAILFGPLTAFACESLVLTLQAFVLGIGGVTVLPINALALGLLGPLAGWAAFHALGRLNRPFALFVAGWAGTAVGAIFIGGLLGLQHEVSPSHFPIPLAVVLPAVAVPHLLFVGVLEGAYTLLAHAMLTKALARAPR
jgi:cobalt/nickel transport system permease protein